MCLHTCVKYVFAHVCCTRVSCMRDGKRMWQGCVGVISATRLTAVVLTVVVAVLTIVVYAVQSVS